MADQADPTGNDIADAAKRAAGASVKTGRAGMQAAAQAGAQAGRSTVDAGSEIAREAAATGETFAEAASDHASRLGETATQASSRMFGDFTKMFAELKLPATPDMQALLSAHRRNVEVLSAANRVALEGAQTVARRHLEIMQQTMSELSEQVRELASPEPPQAKAARQADLLKRSYERAVANMRELSDLIQRSNGEALTLLNQRFTEALDEVRGLIETNKPAA